MRNFVNTVAVLVLLAPAFASADDNLWLGAKAGTLGLGVEGTWRPIDWLDLRVGVNRYDYNRSASYAGIPYDGTLRLDSYYGTANLRFPLSPFRLAVGYFNNNNEIIMRSSPADTFEIGGFSYSADEVGTLGATTQWDTSSPYVGAGFDFELFNRLGLNFDFGVLLQGDPRVSLSSDGLLSDDPIFLDALEAERQELEDDLEALKAYPVVSMGINFNF